MDFVDIEVWIPEMLLCLLERDFRIFFLLEPMFELNTFVPIPLLIPSEFAKKIIVIYSSNPLPPPPKNKTLLILIYWNRIFFPIYAKPKESQKQVRLAKFCLCEKFLAYLGIYLVFHIFTYFGIFWFSWRNYVSATKSTYFMIFIEKTVKNMHLFFWIVAFGGGNFQCSIFPVEIRGNFPFKSDYFRQIILLPLILNSHHWSGRIF